METEKSMKRERKFESIKWTKIKKFHEQVDAREEENMKSKERKRLKLQSSKKETKLINEEWEEIWAVFKGNKEKIRIEKKEWVKGETDTWEE
jgi:hypothetical protein